MLVSKARPARQEAGTINQSPGGKVRHRDESNASADPPSTTAGGLE